MTTRGRLADQKMPGTAQTYSPIPRLSMLTHHAFKMFKRRIGITRAGSTATASDA